jgi:hypothetical protein
MGDGGIPVCVRKGAAAVCWVNRGSHRKRVYLDADAVTPAVVGAFCCGTRTNHNSKSGGQG